MQLTFGQAEMLLFIDKRGSASKGDIRPGYKHRPRSAWWRNIDQLERKGLIVRDSSASYTLTDEGEEEVGNLPECPLCGRQESHHHSME
jgi:DNA-binding MarR family transcriptional regulator